MPSPRTQQAIARLADLTPRQIVAELDRYIVGQADAKKSVAIALRNRWRRQRAPEAIREEISPNNIIISLFYSITIMFKERVSHFFDISIVITIII